MLHKFVLLCLASAFVLMGCTQRVFAQPHLLEELTNRDAVFQVVFSPTQSGMASNRTFGMSVERFKDHLYTAVWDWRDGLRVIRSRDATQWEPVGQPGLGIDPCYGDAYQLFVYRDHLYMTLHDSWVCDLPGLVLRSGDGLVWEIVLKDTPDQALFGQSLPDKLGAGKGYLYLTTRGFTAQIWRSPSGDPGTWQLVNPSLGQMVDSTSPLVEFHDDLYLSDHDENGVHVWRSSAGLSWQSVGQGLLDDPANFYDGCLVVFRDALYFSTANWKYELPFDGGRIYRSKDGTQWDLVVDKGFGNPNPSAIEGLLVFQGSLYAFSSDPTANVIHVWRSKTGNPGDWNRVFPEGIGPQALTVRCGQAVFRDEIYIANYYGQGEEINLIQISWQ